MGDITMNIRDTRRIAVLEKLKEKSMKQGKAAELLGVTVRQIRRLLLRYKQEGAKGVIHKLRGIPGNHQADEKTLDSALDIIRDKYADFSITMAHEKLVKHHGFPYSHETLRVAMIDVGMWKPRNKPKLIVHPIRLRRTKEGELVQIDGSPHDWFEGRALYCNLIVFIDDATGKLKYLQFVPHETTLVYMAGLEQYINDNGKPQALYSDRHGIFRVNSKKKGSASILDEINLTQFGRVAQELTIELIFANSPQAKGRVERMNETLQDRLVKEMRLLGINTLDEGNKYLPTFMEEFNRQFGVVPASLENAHIPLSSHEILEQILVKKDTRIISKNLSISYGNKIMQITPAERNGGRSLVHLQIEVHQDTKGEVTLHHKGRLLKYEIVSTTHTGHIVDSKRLNEVVDHLAPQTAKQYNSLIEDEPWLLFTPKPTHQPLFATT
jgi:transposase